MSTSPLNIVDSYRAYRSVAEIQRSRDSGCKSKKESSKFRLHSILNELFPNDKKQKHSSSSPSSLQHSNEAFLKETSSKAMDNLKKLLQQRESTMTHKSELEDFIRSTFAKLQETTIPPKTETNQNQNNNQTPPENLVSSLDNIIKKASLWSQKLAPLAAAVATKARELQHMETEYAYLKDILKVEKYTETAKSLTERAIEETKNLISQQQKGIVVSKSPTQNGDQNSDITQNSDMTQNSESQGDNSNPALIINKSLDTIVQILEKAVNETMKCYEWWESKNIKMIQKQSTPSSTSETFLWGNTNAARVIEAKLNWLIHNIRIVQTAVLDRIILPDYIGLPKTINFEETMEGNFVMQDLEAFDNDKTPALAMDGEEDMSNISEDISNISEDMSNISEDMSNVSEDVSSAPAKWMTSICLSLTKLESINDNLFEINRKLLRNPTTRRKTEKICGRDHLNWEKRKKPTWAVQVIVNRILRHFNYYFTNVNHEEDDIPTLLHICRPERANHFLMATLKANWNVTPICYEWLMQINGRRSMQMNDGTEKEIPTTTNNNNTHPLLPTKAKALQYFRTSLLHAAGRASHNSTLYAFKIFRKALIASLSDNNEGSMSSPTGESSLITNERRGDNKDIKNDNIIENDKEESRVVTMTATASVRTDFSVSQKVIETEYRKLILHHIHQACVLHLYLNQVLSKAHNCNNGSSQKSSTLHLSKLQLKYSPLSLFLTLTSRDKLSLCMDEVQEEEEEEEEERNYNHLLITWLRAETMTFAAKLHFITILENDDDITKLPTDGSSQSTLENTDKETERAEEELRGWTEVYPIHYDPDSETKSDHLNSGMMNNQMIPLSIIRFLHCLSTVERRLMGVLSMLIDKKEQYDTNDSMTGTNEFMANNSPNSMAENSPNSIAENSLNSMTQNSGNSSGESADRYNSKNSVVSLIDLLFAFVEHVFRKLLRRFVSSMEYHLLHQSQGDVKCCSLPHLLTGIALLKERLVDLSLSLNTAAQTLCAHVPPRSETVNKNHGTPKRAGCSRSAVWVLGREQNWCEECVRESASAENKVLPFGYWLEEKMPIKSYFCRGVEEMLSREDFEIGVEKLRDQVMDLDRIPSTNDTEWRAVNTFALETWKTISGNEELGRWLYLPLAAEMHCISIIINDYTDLHYRDMS
eukprot:g3653.t1